MAKLKVLVNVSNGEVFIDGSKKVVPILESAINTLIESGDFNDRGANSILATMVVTNIDLETDFEYEQKMFAKNGKNYIENIYEAPLEIFESAIKDTMDEINEMYLECSDLSLFDNQEKSIDVSNERKSTFGRLYKEEELEKESNKTFGRSYRDEDDDFDR